MDFFDYIIPSPIGDLYALASDDSLLLLDFADNPDLSLRVGKIVKSSNTSTKPETHPIIRQTILELGEYFTGKRRTFSIPLAVNGTDFQKQAWQGLQQIPYGETRSYSEQAVMIKNPNAVRAIGGANHNNTFVIIIPCHRVIGKNGKMVGYGGGIARKIWLLEHEKQHS